MGTRVTAVGLQLAQSNCHVCQVGHLQALCGLGLGPVTSASRKGAEQGTVEQAWGLPHPMTACF
jgi:hypothetical protein